MNAKKRQRCLGALERRKVDAINWTNKFIASAGKSEEEIAYLKDKATKASAEVVRLQDKLGVR